MAPSFSPEMLSRYLPAESDMPTAGRIPFAAGIKVTLAPATGFPLKEIVPVTSPMGGPVSGEGPHPAATTSRSRIQELFPEPAPFSSVSHILGLRIVKPAPAVGPSFPGLSSGASPFTDNFASGAAAQRVVREQRDALRYESDRSVRKQCLTTTCMQTAGR